MSFTRPDLVQVATTAGWVRGTLFAQHPQLTRQAIRQAISQALQNDPFALADAPREHYSDMGADKIRKTDLQQAVRNLLEELDDIK